MKPAPAIKSRLLGSGGAASGLLGGIGSIHNVCHSLCMTVVSILAIFGITLNILPLMFLQIYQMYFWWAALLFTVLSLYFFFQQHQKVPRDKNLLLLNFGLLIFGLPFTQLAGYTDFLRFLGGALALVGLFLLIFGKKFKRISPLNVGSTQTFVVSPLPDSPSALSHTATVVTLKLPKLNVSSVLFAIVIGGFLINQYFMWQLTKGGRISTYDSVGNSMPKMSRMIFTLFDVALAKERMDKNNDGMCDVCGMPIEQCIDSGMMQCTMDPNATIGLLGSQHVHADWKVYLKGKSFDWTPQADLHERQMKGDTSINNTSAFIHIHPASAPEKAGDVLHMHATGVPLALFFHSLGIIFPDGMAAYINGKKIPDYQNYVFNDWDKVLLTDGAGDLTKQLNSITNFAKDH